MRLMCERIRLLTVFFVFFFLFFTMTFMSQSKAADRSNSPREMIAAGNYDEARRAVLRLAAGRSDAALLIAYSEALIRLHQNDPEGAAAIYREILRVAPDHEAARRDLTLILARTGQTEGALFHAERLTAQTTNEQLRAELEAFISTGRVGPPSGLVFRFSVVPSSNAARGTREENFIIGDFLFEIDERSREGSDIGVSIGATAWNRWRISEDLSATLIGSLDALTYAHKLPSQQQASIKLNLSRKINDLTTLSVSPLANIQLVDGSIKRSRLGLGFAAEVRLNGNREITGSLNAWQQRYSDENFRNGNLFFANVGYRQIVSTRDVVGLSFSYGLEHTRRDYLDNGSAVVGGAWERQWRSGLFTNIHIAIGQDNYQGMFPGTSIERSDKLLRAGASFRHSDFTIAGFAPEIGYLYTRSFSNISLFDYRAHDLTVGFSRRF